MIPEIVLRALHRPQPPDTREDIVAKIVTFTIIFCSVICWFALRKVGVPGWLALFSLTAFLASAGIALDKKRPYAYSKGFYRFTAILSSFFVLLVFISNMHS